MAQDKYKRWTPQEDAILISCINQCPGNNAKAFRMAEEQLEGRDFKSCGNRWYKVLSKNPHVNNMAISGNHAIATRRVVREGCPVEPVPIKESKWRKIWRSIFGE